MGLSKKMHNNEIEVTDEIVRTLINEQFPAYKDLSIERVISTGTVNAIFRLGEEFCVRLPILNSANDSLHVEFKILPVISKKVSLNIPEVIEKGKPNSVFPHDWAIYKWIKGDTYNNSAADEIQVSEALAGFITELRSINVTSDLPRAGRKPLVELDDITVNALNECEGDIDIDSAKTLWKKIHSVKPWDKKPVWIHSDLLKPNLLVFNGKLSAIIDFGSAGVGDPAFDIIPAWSSLSHKTRYLFKEALNVDDDTWLRAKLYALHQAALILPYYRKTNPVFSKLAKSTILSTLSCTQ